MLNYPAFIEPGTDSTAFGVVIPDLPGCFSAGDTLDEAMENAQEAITLWIDTALDEGEIIPKPSDIGTLARSKQYRGWILASISIDPAVLDDTVERVNITLPRRVLARIDAKAKEVGETRSGYIARMSVG